MFIFNIQITIIKASTFHISHQFSLARFWKKSKIVEKTSFLVGYTIISETCLGENITMVVHTDCCTSLQYRKQGTVTNSNQTDMPAFTVPSFVNFWSIPYISKCKMYGSKTVIIISIYYLQIMTKDSSILFWFHFYAPSILYHKIKRYTCVLQKKV